MRYEKLFCVLVYLPLIFSSCKEEEDVILSNDIIVGDWVLYHKEIFDSDNNLSFSANNGGDSETTSLSIKSDYTCSAPAGFGTQPVSNLWANSEFNLSAGSHIGVWIKNEYGFYRFTDDDSAINCQDAFFYCNNNIVVLQIGGHQGSNQNKQLYYFQRTGYDFSDCNEISYNENP